MSQYSTQQIQALHALKIYAAEVMRQCAEKEVELAKEEGILTEVEEMVTGYPDDLEIMALFESQSEKRDGLLLELNDLEMELDDAKNQIRNGLNDATQNSSDHAFKEVEAHMASIGKEMPRVSAIAKKMKQDELRKRLEALKQKASVSQSDTEQAIAKQQSELNMSENPTNADLNVKRKPL